MIVSRTIHTLAGSACALLLAGCAARAPHASPVPLSSALYLQPLTGRLVDTETLVDALRGAEVVLFGESHDDAEAHLAQLRLLRELRARGIAVVLALEMFERDVQPALSAYLAGDHSEESFLAAARPWPNYAAAYRPLLELARSANWPVVASNVPRPIAAAVARGGLDALGALPAVQRPHHAAPDSMTCPRDSDFDRFEAEMHGHGGSASVSSAEGRDESIHRIYLAQCIKDETMAESIVSALAEWPGALVVHVNGAFHSDFRLGIAPRVERRRAGTRLVVLSAPTEEGRAPPPSGVHRGDFVLTR